MYFFLKYLNKLHFLAKNQKKRTQDHETTEQFKTMRKEWNKIC